jgi:hypothetical protein
MKTTDHTSSGDAINTFAGWRPVLKPIGRLLIAAQLALILQPLSVMAQDRQSRLLDPLVKSRAAQFSQLGQTQQPLKPPTAADDIAKKLVEAQELVNQLKLPGVTERTAKKEELNRLLRDVQAGVDLVLVEFKATRAELEGARVPTDIIARHEDAVVALEQRAASFARLLSASAGDDEKISNLADFFKRYPAKRRYTPIDPTKLPWDAPKIAPRMPAETQTSWHRNLTGGQRVLLAQAGGLTSIGGVQFTFPPEPGEAPQDADLAETADVQMTSAIRAKAQELGYNPVNIENWVRNNVEWIPSWGSVHGAEGALKTLRGNAFDIASLTIALLRASGIPSRYQFGTVDVPVNEAMNWVGGVQTANDVLNLMYQGGIAARGLASGGRIAMIRMEHVWVNAYVNWSPSRGTRHGGGASTPPVFAQHGQFQHPSPNAQLNTWAPIEASFKQYTYTQGLDLRTAAPVDAAALVQAAQLGATFTADYTQNPNIEKFEGLLRNYSEQQRAYIDSAIGKNATVSDVLGGRRIREQDRKLLAGVPPLAVAAIGNQRSELPETMRWRVGFEGGSPDSSGATLAKQTFNLSDLLGKRVSITYEGATVSDQQVIASYRANGASSFPAYVIKVRPLLRIDDRTVVTGNAVGMGADVEWRVNIIPPGSSEFAGNVQAYSMAAGDETVWAVIGNSVDAAELQSIQFPHTATGQLHAVGMSYWHQVDTYAKLIAKREQAVTLRMPSLGAVSSPLRVQFVWGVARSAHYLNRNIDVAHSSMGVQGMDQTLFQREIGARMSFMEGSVFDQVFGREAGTGVSAVRVIQAALASGQRVYKLTSGNADQYFGLIQMSRELKEEVINALLMGLEVTVPERPQNLNGWEGTAYIAIRPESGAGAYIISGGLRGGDEAADCQLQPSTQPATAANFSPAVMIAAAIIALIILSRFPQIAVFVGLVVLSQSAAATAAPQLPSHLQPVWNQLSGGRPWPTQFNWPPPYGTPPLPYGTCTPEQHATLQAAKNLACGQPMRCLGTDSCPQIETKMANRQACIDARIAIMEICYLGGDAEHWDQVQQQLNGLNNCITCKAKKEAAQQCTSGGT